MNPEVDKGVSNTESAAFQSSFGHWAITLDTSHLTQAPNFKTFQVAVRAPTMCSAQIWMVGHCRVNLPATP